MPNINTKFTLSGEKEYQQAISKIGDNMRMLNSEMRKVETAYARNADSVEALTAKNAVYQKGIDKQKEKIETYRKAVKAAQDAQDAQNKKLEEAAKTLDKGSDEYKSIAEGAETARKKVEKWQTSLNNAEAELNNLNNKLDENKEKIEESGKETGNLGDVVSGLTEKFGIKLPEGMQKSMNSMGSLNTTSVKIAGGFVALAVAIAKAEKALIAMTKDSAAFADNIITSSMQTGQTTDQLQEFSYATELIDVSVDTLQGSLTKLTNNMQDTINGTGNAKASFEALGISVTDADGNMRSANDVFYETIDALGDVKNETERDAMAMDIFGRSAQDLNPLIIQGSETLKAYAQEAHNVGYVLDDEALSALGAVDDAYQRLQKSQEGAKNQLSAEFAPYLTEFYEKITKIIKDGGQALKDSGLVDSFGMLLETVGDIIAPTDQLSSDTVPKLTEALRPMAEIMAGIADTIDFISGAATVLTTGIWDWDKWSGGWKQMGKAAGFGYSYGNGNNTQALKEKWEQTDVNRATSANGYGQYYANGKWYSNYESYLRDEWEKSGTGTTFEYWKMQKGYNASGTDYWRGGRTLIGEYGPEEVVLPQGTRILTAQETRQASGGDTFYITIPANTVKEFNDIVNIARNKRRTDRMGVDKE
jgi:hypothetical protein